MFYQVWKRLETEEHPVLTLRVKGGKEFDRGKPVKVCRHWAVGSGEIIGKLSTAVVQLFCAAYFIIFNRVKKIHAGQIWISGTIGYLCKQFLGKPYILWVYGGETTPVYMKGRFSAFWAKTLLNNAEKLVTNSKFCQKEFLDYGFSESKCPIILPATDPDFFTPGKPPDGLVRKWNAEGDIILLTVARVSERKGHDLVIRSLPKILRRHPQVKYLIVGKGPDTERLKKLSVDLGVGDKVVFCGFVPDEELPDYYRLCDLYVMPNREVFDSTDSIEGFGISFIEASACGKPVIGGRSGGAVEAIAEGESGFLVLSEAVEEFTEAVCKLIEDKDLRKKMGRLGRLRVEKEMDWRTRGVTVVEIEKSIAKGGR